MSRRFIGIAALALVLVAAPLTVMVVMPSSFTTRVVTRVFSGAGFLPQAASYTRHAQVIWLHVIADGAIGLSCLSLAGAAGWLAARFPAASAIRQLFLALAIFLGLSVIHFAMQIWTVWQGVYLLSGAVKMLLAVTGLAAAAALPCLAPRALKELVSSGSPWQAGGGPRK